MIRSARTLAKQAALLAKTSVVTLPAVVVVIRWWQGRRVSGREAWHLGVLALVGALSAWPVLAREHLHAEADPERLRQVLGHLIENAVKFSPDGGTVTVAARRRNGAVEVSVSDEGVGIPPGERERIFRKFYRGDTSGQRGTGLGLFIVKAIVEAHGGRLRAEPNADGPGMRFSVSLPCHENSA